MAISKDTLEVKIALVANEAIKSLKETIDAVKTLDKTIKEKSKAEADSVQASKNAAASEVAASKVRIAAMKEEIAARKTVNSVALESERAAKIAQMTAERTAQAEVTAAKIVNQMAVEREKTIRIEAASRKRAAKDAEADAKKVADSGGVIGKAFESVMGGLRSSFAPITALNQGVQLLSTSFTALASSMRESLTPAIELQTSVAKITTLLSEQEKATFKVGEEILRVQSLTGAKQSDIAAGYYDLLASGAVKAADSTEFLLTAQKLAVGGMTTLAESTKILRSTMAAYGMEAADVGKVSDALFIAARDGATDVQQLSQEMGGALGVASMLGVSFEELAAFISAITLTGVSTSEAVTSVNSAMVALSRQTDDMSRALSDLGIYSIEAAIKQEGLVGVLRKVTQGAGGSAEAVINLMGRVEAMKAVSSANAPVIGKKFDDMFKSIKKSQDNVNEVTGKAYQTMSERFEYQWSKALGNVNSIFASLGEGSVAGLTDMIKGLNESLNTLAAIAKGISAVMKDSNFKEIVKDLAAIAAVIGTVTLALTFALKAIVMFKEAVIALRLAVAALTIAFSSGGLIGILTAVLAPIAAFLGGSMVAAVAAVTAAILLLWEAWKGIESIFTGKYEPGLVVSLFKSLGEAVGIFKDEVKEAQLAMDRLIDVGYAKDLRRQIDVLAGARDIPFDYTAGEGPRVPETAPDNFVLDTKESLRSRAVADRDTTTEETIKKVRQLEERNKSLRLEVNKRVLTEGQAIRAARNIALTEIKGIEDTLKAHKNKNEQYYKIVRESGRLVNAEYESQMYDLNKKIKIANAGLMADLADMQGNYKVKLSLDYEGTVRQWKESLLKGIINQREFDDLVKAAGVKLKLDVESAEISAQRIRADLEAISGDASLKIKLDYRDSLVAMKKALAEKMITQEELDKITERLQIKLNIDLESEFSSANIKSAQALGNAIGGAVTEGMSNIKNGLLEINQQLEEFTYRAKKAGYEVHEMAPEPIGKENIDRLRDMVKELKLLEPKDSSSASESMLKSLEEMGNIRKEIEDIIVKAEKTNSDVELITLETAQDRLQEMLDTLQEFEYVTSSLKDLSDGLFVEPLENAAKIAKVIAKTKGSIGSTVEKTPEGTAQRKLGIDINIPIPSVDATREQTKLVVTEVNKMVETANSKLQELRKLGIIDADQAKKELFEVSGYALQVLDKIRSEMEETLNPEKMTLGTFIPEGRRKELEKMQKSIKDTEINIQYEGGVGAQAEKLRSETEQVLKVVTTDMTSALPLLVDKMFDKAKLQEGAMKASTEFTTAFLSIFPDVSKGFLEVFASWKKVVKSESEGFWSNLGEVILDVLGAIGKSILAVFNSIISSFGFVGSAVKAAILNMMANMNIYAMIIQFFNKDKEAFKKQIWEAISSLIELLPRLAENVPTLIASILAYLPQMIQSVLSNAPTLVIDFFTSIVYGISKFAENLMPALEKLVRGFFDNLLIAAARFGESFAAIIVSAVMSPISTVITYILKAVDWINSLFDVSTDNASAFQKWSNNAISKTKALISASNKKKMEEWIVKPGEDEAGKDGTGDEEKKGARFKAVGGAEFRVKEYEGRLSNTEERAFMLASEEFDTKAEDFSDAISESESSFFDGVGDMLGDGIAKIVDWGTAIWDGFVAAFETTGDWFATQGKALWDGLVAGYDAAKDWFKEKGKEIWDGLTDAFQKVGNWFKERGKDMWDGLVGAVTDPVGFFKAWGKFIWDGFVGDVGNWFEKQGAKIWDGFLGPVGAWFIARGNDIWNGFMLPIADFFWALGADIWGGFVGAMNKLGDWFALQGEKIWNGFLGALNKLGDWFALQGEKIWDGFLGALNRLGDWFALQGEKIWNGFLGALNRLGDWFSAQGEKIWNGFIGGFNKLGDWFATQGEKIWGGLTGAFGKVGTWFSDKGSGIWSGFTGAFSGGSNFFSLRGGETWKGFTGSFNNSPTWFSDKGSSIWGGFSGAATAAWTWIKSIGAAIWEGHKTAAIAAWEWIKTIGSTIWGGLKTAAVAAWDWVKSIGSAIWSGLKTSLDGFTWSGLGTKIVSGIKDAFKGAVDYLKGLLNALNPFNLVEKLFKWTGWGGKGTVEKWISKVVPFDVPFIEFAEGGYVPGKARTSGNSLANDVVPAMLSPGEVVIPRSIALDPQYAAMLKAILSGNPIVNAAYGIDDLVYDTKKIGSDIVGGVKGVGKAAAGLTGDALNVYNWLSGIGSGVNYAKMLIDPVGEAARAFESVISSWIKPKMQNILQNAILKGTASMAQGGIVPGRASVAGDSMANDKIMAMLSPGEMVLPRTTVSALLDRTGVQGKGAAGETAQNITVSITVQSGASITEASLRRELVPKVIEELRKVSQNGAQVISKRGVY